MKIYKVTLTDISDDREWEYYFTTKENVLNYLSKYFGIMVHLTKSYYENDNYTAYIAARLTDLNPCEPY